MPAANIVLMLLIGLTLGGIASVFLRAKRSGFIVNILLGIVGAALGGLFPILVGSSANVGVVSADYLIRALLGAFVLILLASLFRSAKPHH